MARNFRRVGADAPEEGLTLVEMVVAISVLAVVMVAAAGVLSSGLRALSAAKARARGNEIATQGIEDLQRFSFNNLGLCTDPTTVAGTTQPSGLESTVFLGCTGTVNLEDPCHPETAGSVPRFFYTCSYNNIDYSVARYVAWADELQTVKRLAVYVEWDDLNGRHQVSQQSSLRAPDQSAITGLAPPSFTTAPTARSPTGTYTVQIDADGRLATNYRIDFSATVSNLNKEGSSVTTGAIPAHDPGDRFTVGVSNGGTLFPSYNGFPVTIGTEGFTVASGAGTNTWTVVAETAGSTISSNASVSFAGDKVYALFQTIGPNGSPQTSTVFLDLVGSTWTNSLEWNLSPGNEYRFGAGSQYVSFGILRVSDGKTVSAFSSPVLTFQCTACATTPAVPTLTATTTQATAGLGASGQLQSDINVTVTTQNVTSADTVTMSFLTKAGSTTVALTLSGTCPDSASYTTGTACTWTGKIAANAGYRFDAGAQKIYVGAQQIVDTVNPSTVDTGSTGATEVSVTL